MKKLIAVFAAGLLSGAPAAQEKIEWNSLPMQDAFVFGVGSRRVAIFSDPACLPCRMLERDLEKRGIAVFVFPVISDKDKESAELNRAIACAPNPAEAWQNWMTAGIQPPAREEENCIAEAAARNKNFAKTRSINVVPTAIFEDGTRAVGAAAIKSALAGSK